MHPLFHEGTHIDRGAYLQIYSLQAIVHGYLGLCVREGDREIDTNREKKSTYPPLEVVELWLHWVFRCPGWPGEGSWFVPSVLFLCQSGPVVDSKTVHYSSLTVPTSKNRKTNGPLTLGEPRLWSDSGSRTLAGQFGSVSCTTQEEEYV